MAVTSLAGPVSMSRKPTSEARRRVFICHECGTTEPVPWCGQRPELRAP